MVLQGTCQYQVVFFMKNYFICKHFYTKKIGKKAYVEEKILERTTEKSSFLIWICSTTLECDNIGAVEGVSLAI